MRLQRSFHNYKLHNYSCPSILNNEQWTQIPGLLPGKLSGSKKDDSLISFYSKLTELSTLI
ncbi:MAG: hypothetical protein ABIN01_22315 [Ferruginibacter sp.]